MKKIFLIVILLLLAGVGIYWFVFRNKETGDSGPKPQPIALKKHSSKFNTRVDSLMLSYFDLKSAFVEADTVLIKKHCQHFLQMLDSIPVADLKNDTATIIETVQSSINDIRSNASSLMKQSDITEMRQDFRMVSEMMYPAFFKAINYSGPKLYWQNCPMAFGEGKEGNWISNSEDIENPYLGKKHPEFKATMLHCGEIKDSIVAQ
jgi:hypothetical protein